MKAIISSVIGLIVLILAFSMAYKSSTESTTFTVTEKERVVTNNDSKYLIYTENEVFQNTDSFLFWKFNSSDIYGEIQEGDTYTVTVAGWRVQFLSMYRNIIEIEQPKPE